MCERTPRTERELPLSRSAPALARAFLREATCVAHAGEVLDDAVLLVSEVVTNAVLHGGSPIVVTVECDGRALQVRVRDGSPVLPTPRETGSTDDENGRGLRLIDLISAEWGVDPAPEGKNVWFRVG